MSCLKAVSSLFILMSISFAAFAETKTLAEELAPRGLTYEFSDGKLDILIDETKAKQTIPFLQQQGILPKGISAAEINKMPITASIEAVGMSFTVVLVHVLFKNNSALQKIHVDAYFMPSNAGIFARKKPCYSFDFDRATYDKINWSQVTTKDFMLQTTNFELQLWCKEMIVSESKKKR